jgi:hypothetical protein
LSAVALQPLRNVNKKLKSAPKALKITLFDTVLNSKNNGIFVYAVEPLIIKLFANL